MNELIGKKVYSYIAYSNRILVRIYEITDVYEKKEIMVVIGAVIHIPLSNIGKSSCFGPEWFTFERDDLKARMVLLGYANGNFFKAVKGMLDEMLEKMEMLKENHEKLTATIQYSEIEKDSWYWERYGNEDDE